MYFDDRPEDTDRYDHDPDPDQPWDDLDVEDPAEERDEQARPETCGWRGTLLAACRAGLCWLRRFGHPLLGALGLAFVAGLAGWIGGPLAGAGSDLMASALNLAEFASRLQSGSDLLST